MFHLNVPISASTLPCQYFVLGYTPVPVDDKLLPSHRDHKSFDYSSIFNYEPSEDDIQFKSVFKFEDVGRTSYEADYFKVNYLNLSGSE